MRIVLLNQYYAPDEAATAQVSRDLGAALVADGHQVTAVCGDRSYADPSRRYSPCEEIDGVNVRRVRISGFGRASSLGRLADYSAFMAGAMWSMLRIDRPDVIISLTTPPMIALAGASAARLRRSKSVLWSMDVYPEILYALGALRRGSIAGRMLERLSSVMRSQDVVIALGESMAERVRAAGARRVEVVHNWSDEEAIVPMDASNSELRRQWGWDGRFVVLYSGNFGLAHDFETILGAAGRLRDVLFAFVGTGPRLGEIERQRDALGLTNIEIRRPVPREKLHHVLAAGDIHLVTLKPGVPGLLVPSKIYGILAAGRPTLYVGPAEGEVYDILRAGQCGTRVANGDAVALAGTIEGYRDSDALRQAEGSRARELFLRRYTKRRAMAQFRAILQSLYTGENLLTVPVSPR